MSDTAAAQSPIEQARALFAGEELPFPPLSAEAAAALQEVGPDIFATRPFDITPYGLEAYSDRLQRSPLQENYALLGVDGHGINSWAMHYFVVKDALALFIQRAWGGAYHDADERRRAIAASFAFAKTLQDETRRARQDGLIPPGWRLLVVASDYAEPGWAWVPAPPPGPEAIEWHPGRGLRAATTKALDDLRSGAVKLG
jgi:hypothetical protein